MKGALSGLCGLVECELGSSQTLEAANTQSHRSWMSSSEITPADGPRTAAVASQVAPSGSSQSAFSAKPEVSAVLSAMMHDWKEAGSEAINLSKDIAMALKEKRAIGVSLEQAVVLLFFILLALDLILISLLRGWLLACFTAVGTGVGLAFSLLYYLNLKNKAESCQMVREWIMHCFCLCRLSTVAICGRGKPVHVALALLCSCHVGPHPCKHQNQDDKNMLHPLSVLRCLNDPLSVMRRL